MRELTLADPRRSTDCDADLVEALRRQEPGSIEALIAQYADRVYRLAMHITGSRPDAEEVVQDAFWRVVQKIETFRGDAAFGSWLYRITTNCAYSTLRVRRARHQETWMHEGSVMVDAHVPEFQDWSARIADPALQFELRNVLTAALDSLPEAYRAIVVLRDVEELSLQDVSQITGLSVGAVKTRTHRARLVLRERLGEYLSDRPLSLSPPTRRRDDGRAGRRGLSSGSRISAVRSRSTPCDRPAAEADRGSMSEPDARVHV
jgi:RNA polymerase sigma-70 factor (ECF subfamily)